MCHVSWFAVQIFIYAICHVITSGANESIKKRSLHIKRSVLFRI